ncbi:MAG: ferrous iron transport protein A [Fimbriimonadales bacterium]|nr:ferrous iron transport protein A [Fimbriimonadales bacterium]MDW8051615.1 FeoA family protein [Armatimonadota bacterium]
MDAHTDSVGSTQASQASAAIPLTQLPVGVPARVVQIVHDADGHWRKLSVLGLVPGVTLCLLQRFPTYAVRVGLATIAIDGQLASLVRVEPLQTPQTSAGT